MPVLPEEITTTGLPRRWRGYDRAQVTALLDRVSTDYTEAIARIADTAEARARARADHDELAHRLDGVTESARTDAAQARADADAAATAIRTRAENAAAQILQQAEQAADALTARAQALRTAAQADADDARTRLDDADRHARQLEDAARERWEALRAETEARFEQLQIAERRFAERTRRIETALAGLRSQIGLLDQVRQIEQTLATVRPDTAPEQPSDPSSWGGADTREP